MIAEGIAYVRKSGPVHVAPTPTIRAALSGRGPKVGPRRPTAR
jgi:hypothetical protein